MTDEPLFEFGETILHGQPFSAGLSGEPVLGAAAKPRAAAFVSPARRPEAARRRSISSFVDVTVV